MLLPVAVSRSVHDHVSPIIHPRHKSSSKSNSKRDSSKPGSSTICWNNEHNEFGTQSRYSSVGQKMLRRRVPSQGGGIGKCQRYRGRDSRLGRLETCAKDACFFSRLVPRTAKLPTHCSSLPWLRVKDFKRCTLTSRIKTSTPHYLYSEKAEFES